MKLTVIFLGMALVPILIWKFHSNVVAYARDTLNGTLHFTVYILHLTGIIVVGFVLIFGLYYFINYCYHLESLLFRTAIRLRIGHLTPNNVIVHTGQVDNASGDHEEFHDFPEIFMPEPDEDVDVLAAANRIRRPRMMTTLLHDHGPSSSMNESLLEICQALMSSTNEIFLTPTSTPTEPRSRSPMQTPRSLQREQTGPEINAIVVNIRHDDIDEDLVSEEVELQPQKVGQAFLKTSKEQKTHLQNAANITLHQFPRGLTKPCLSYDAMFLETFIRLTDIPCNVLCDCYDTSGPWITWDDNKICGVEDCTKLLKDRFPEKTNIFTVYGDRNASSWSIQLVLDHLLCCLRSWRWIIENGSELLLNQPGWNEICKDFDELRKTMKLNLWTKGFGRKSYRELSVEILKDLESVSSNLGTKPFLLGDTPTEIDCIAFSILCQMYGQGSILWDKLQGITTLVHYCERVRQLLWPDWDDQLGLDEEMDDDDDAKTKLSLDINAEEHFDADFAEKSRCENSTRFQNDYYQLVPSFDECESVTTNSVTSSTAVCNHYPSSTNEECVIFCTRCKVSKQSKSNPIRLIPPDVDLEYFDDDFSDMQKISYSSHCGKI